MGTILLLLEIYSWCLIIYALISWVDPRRQNPVSQFLAVICEPVLTPIRRALPSMGGLDLSVLVAIVVIQVLVQVL